MCSGYGLVDKTLVQHASTGLPDLVLCLCKCMHNYRNVSTCQEGKVLEFIVSENINKLIIYLICIKLVLTIHQSEI